MRVRQVLKATLVSAAFAATLVTLAGPASAAPPPWVVAGDSNGALDNCDPAFLAKTSNEGTTWATQSAFQPTTSPCALGGRINEVAAAPNGRWFAAGYRYTASGRKQGILFYSEDATTWSEARVIPEGPTDTEYIDVAADGQYVTVLSNKIVESASHPIGGSMTTGWASNPSMFVSSIYQDFVLRDVDVERPWSAPNEGQSAWFVGSAITPTGNRCGVFADLNNDPFNFMIVDKPQGFDVCIPGYDVSLEAVENGPSGHLVSVGSATAPGQATRPVVSKRPGSPSTTQMLPGEGSLRSVHRGATVSSSLSVPSAWPGRSEMWRASSGRPTKA